MSSPGDSVQIGPPTLFERRAWRMLLPEVAAGPDRANVLIARAPLDGQTGSPPRVVGAVAVSVSPLHVPHRGPRVAVHVIPPFRRRGIARQLLESASSLVPTNNEVLYTWSVIAPDSPKASAYGRLGFSGRVILAEQEIPLADIETRLGPLHDRAVARGGIPADARLVSLADVTPAQLDQVIDLHVRHLGGTQSSVREMLRTRMPPHDDARYSMVLLRGERVAGFVLSHMANRVTHVCDTIVVEPGHRGRWANVWLRIEPCRRLMALGVTSVRFESFAHNPDTRSFARQLGGAAVSESVRLYRPLPPRPAETRSLA